MWVRNSGKPVEFWDLFQFSFTQLYKRGPPFFKKNLLISVSLIKRKSEVKSPPSPPKCQSLLILGGRNSGSCSILFSVVLQLKSFITKDSTELPIPLIFYRNTTFLLQFIFLMWHTPVSYVLYCAYPSFPQIVHNTFTSRIQLNAHVQLPSFPPLLLCLSE